MKGGRRGHRDSTGRDPEWMEQATETMREKAERYHTGRSSPRGKIKDWKTIAVEHVSEVERLNKEHLANEKMWESFLQKVLDANKQLEIQKKHLKAENEALKWHSENAGCHALPPARTLEEPEVLFPRTVEEFKNGIGSLGASYYKKETERCREIPRNGNSLEVVDGGITSLTVTNGHPTDEQTIQVLHDTLDRQRGELRNLDELLEAERRRNRDLQDLNDDLAATCNGYKADIEANAQIRDELLKRVNNADNHIQSCAKLLDLLRDFDPEGVEDMRRLLQEIDGVIVMPDSELNRLTDEDEHWKAKKTKMSETIQSLFDNAVSIEQRRKRLRFEQTAALMWASNPGSTRKERAIMESLYALDKGKRHSQTVEGPFNAGCEKQGRSHQLFARLMESEAGLGMLPAPRTELPASYRRKVFDHSMKTRKIQNDNQRILSER